MLDDCIGSILIEQMDDMQCDPPATLLSSEQIWRRKRVALVEDLIFWVQRMIYQFHMCHG